MPLQYMPFVNSQRIQHAAKSDPPMRRGERNDDVAILQQALVDYGYELPRSTRNHVLDGIYGREMYEKIRFFQTRNNLSIDGIAGEQTFTCLDHLMTTGTTAKPPKVLTLHFRSLCLTQVPFSQQLRNCQRVYAQYNIEVRFGSGLSLLLSEEEASRFDTVDGSCEWVIEDGEYAELQRMGSEVPRSAIAVFYVNRFSETDLLGCGGHLPNRPACIVAARGGEWDLAHEVGHVLLTSDYEPVHHPSRQNLMYAFSHSPRGVPSLNTHQLAKIRQSPLLH